MWSLWYVTGKVYSGHKNYTEDTGPLQKYLGLHTCVQYRTSVQNECACQFVGLVFFIKYIFVDRLQRIVP